MRFAKRFALFNGQKTFLPVSDALIDYLNRFADTCRKSIVQVFLPNTTKKLAPEQFKNAAKVLRLLRFWIVQQVLIKDQERGVIAPRNLIFYVCLFNAYTLYFKRLFALDKAAASLHADTQTADVKQHCGQMTQYDLWGYRRPIRGRSGWICCRLNFQTGCLELHQSVW